MDDFSFKDVINGSESYWNEKGKNLESKENPKVYFLGGQSGAGKSKLKDRIGKNNLVIDVDEFRKYHPNYFELYKKYGKDSAKYTHNFASAVADELVKKSMEKKVDVIVDGTLKSLKTPKERAEEYKKNGYSLEINTVVVKPEKSFLSNLMRYEELIEEKKIPRLAPKEIHDECVKNFPVTVSELYKTKLFDNIKLYNRENECVYDMSKTPNIDPKSIIEKEFTREWKKEEYIEYLNQWEKLIGKMKDRNAEDIEIKIALAEKEKLIKNIRIENPEIKKTNEKENPWSKKIEKDKSKGLGRS
ncbi:zeta toxin family protein [Fusobacterium polymorphum]|uniref:zeta toxin family protein n=1 Tax=Fusobacterium nucleatum subsp. polymorphum TaxID=76857 RepID=UPI003009C95C